jgi:hypothetical protein
MSSGYYYKNIDVVNVITISGGNDNTIAAKYINFGSTTPYTLFGNYFKPNPVGYQINSIDICNLCTAQYLNGNNSGTIPIPTGVTAFNFVILGGGGGGGGGGDSAWLSDQRYAGGDGGASPTSLNFYYGTVTHNGTNTIQVQVGAGGAGGAAGNKQEVHGQATATAQGGQTGGLTNLQYSDLIYGVGGSNGGGPGGPANAGEGGGFTGIAGVPGTSTDNTDNVLWIPGGMDGYGGAGGAAATLNTEEYLTNIQPGSNGTSGGYMIIWLY